MALFSFKKNKKTLKTPKQMAAEAQAKRRAQALETGYVEHPEIQREYKRKRFFIIYENPIRAAFWLAFGAVLLLTIALVAYVVISNLPGRDDDKDGIPNTEDVCPGHDDLVDDDKDGIPNGCEERPIFPDLSIVESKIISLGNDRYDVAIQAENRNVDWGASPLKYSIQLIDGEGKVINSSQAREGFILPGQKKYFVAFNILAIQKPKSAVLAVSLIDWQKVQNYREPKFKTETISFDQPKNEGIFARLKGKTTNLTAYTFNNIVITILLYDKDHNLVGLNQSEIDTLQPNEDRDFIVTFPEEIAGVTSSGITYETNVDVFGNDTFVQSSVVQGQRFQQFTPQPEKNY